MITNTQSFKKLKDSTQDIFNFILLSKYSIPDFIDSIKDFPEDGVIRPKKNIQFYANQTKKQLNNSYSSFDLNLSKYTLLSAFSFFESYIPSIVNEIINFHGGLNHVKVKLNKSKALILNSHGLSSINDIFTFINSYDNATLKKRNKIRERYKPNNKERYEIISKELLSANYLFPLELLNLNFNSTNLNRLLKEIGKDYKSYKIPDILTNYLFMNVSIAEKNDFDTIRKLRNQIGHGDEIILEIKDVINYNRFLRDFALRIDTHIVNNFFVVNL